MRIFPVLLLPLAALAGCVGGPDDEGLDPTGDNGMPGPDQGGNNTTARNDTDDSYEWREEPRNGTVTTMNAVVASANTQGGAEDFSVQNGTRQLALNITTDGGELDVMIAGPGCEPNTGCEESASTTGGSLNWTSDEPATGDWTIRLFGGEPGPQEVGYELVIGQQVPVA